VLPCAIDTPPSESVVDLFEVSYELAGAMAAAIIRHMSDKNRRMVVEQHGGAIRYTPRSSDIRVHVRLPMDGSVEGEAPRNVVRLREAT
jgi:hypothetical protein